MSLKMPNFQGAPIILGTHRLFTQTVVDSVYNLRAADFYGYSGPMLERNSTLPGIAKIAAEFSKFCNFTPIVKELDELGKSENFTGAVIPFVVGSVVSKTKNCCGGHIETSVSLSFYHEFNFAYCDFNREIVPNDVSLLLYPMDSMTWIFLLVSSMLLCIYFIVGGKLRKGWEDKSGAIFSVFATYLLFNWKTRTTNNSGLLILWSFVFIVLNNCYSGVLTSLLVAPLQLDVITGVKGLVEKKYNLTFGTFGAFSYVLILVGNLLESQKVNSDNSSLPGLTLSTALKLPTLPEFIETVAFTPKTATFGPWEYSSQLWNTLQNRNDEYNARTKHKSKQRSCHIGRELSSQDANPTFWIFKFPGKETTSRVSHAFNRMHSSGIHDYWMNVFFWMQASPRAQDVNKYKSISEVKSTTGGKVWPLGFDRGSVSVVFRIYLICIAGSGLVFGLEFVKFSWIITTRIYKLFTI
ncbi:uncharacterized protein LOC118437285 [Folsomia candida]|uniref:uncharacterized protein LOC118437285 n=1 Tax=Folsomia candida TaxID=158441 RepID=UPI001604CD01|nr:uncharacterized protein LOC118437285 [Folsomia candida]